MLNASLLSIIEDAGIAVLTLTEGLEADEFLASRLTRAETARQFRIMSDAAANLPPQVHTLLAEIDWDGWQTVAQQTSAGGKAEREALWFAVRSLAPATLMWLRVYRKSLPEIFECKPEPDAWRGTLSGMTPRQEHPMQVPLRLEGEHLHLASQGEIIAGIKAAAAVFAQHDADPLACATAYEKMQKDELLTRDEALLCVIWDAADDKAFRAVTLGWLARDVDIRLAPGQAA